MKAFSNKRFVLQVMLLLLIIVVSSCSERKDKRWFYIFDKDIELRLDPEYLQQLHEMNDSEIANLKSSGNIEDAMRAGSLEDMFNETLEFKRGWCFLTKKKIEGDFLYPSGDYKFLVPAGSYRLMTCEEVLSAKETGNLPDGTVVSGPQANYHFRTAIKDYEVAQADDSWEGYKAPGSSPLWTLWPLLIPVLLVMFFSYISDFGKEDEEADVWLTAPVLTVGAMVLEIIFYFLFKGRINDFVYSEHSILVALFSILLLIGVVLVNVVAAFRVNSNIMDYYGLRIKGQQWLIAIVGLVVIWFIAGSFAKSIGISGSQNIRIFRLVVMGAIALVYFGLIFYKQNREYVKALPIMVVLAIVLEMFLYLAFWVILLILVVTVCLNMTIFSGKGFLGDSDMRSDAEIRKAQDCSDCRFYLTDECKHVPGGPNSISPCWEKR